MMKKREEKKKVEICGSYSFWEDDEKEDDLAARSECVCMCMLSALC